MIAALAAPPVVAIPQAVDRLVAGLVVVAQEWMAVRQGLGGGRLTTVVLIRPGVDHVMESSEHADRLGMVHSEAVQERHQDLLAGSIGVKGSGDLNHAVRMTAVRMTAVRVTAALTIDALKIGVSVKGASMIAVMVIAVKGTVVMEPVVMEPGALKTGVSRIAAKAISALRGVGLKTGVLRTVVLEVVASVMAIPAASVPDVPNTKTVSRLQNNLVGKRLPMGLIPWLMICSGAVMPHRQRWRLVVRSIASGAPVRCVVLRNSCSFSGMPRPPEFLWRKSPGLVWLR